MKIVITTHGGYIFNKFEFKEFINNYLLHIDLIYSKGCLTKFGEKTTLIKNLLQEIIIFFYYQQLLFNIFSTNKTI